MIFPHNAPGRILVTGASGQLGSYVLRELRARDWPAVAWSMRPDMELFGTVRAEADGARRAAQAMQVPVYAGLTREQIERVASTVPSSPSSRSASFHGSMTLR